MNLEPNKLYIGNLSYDVTDDDLTVFLEHNGINVRTCHVVIDKNLDRSKGFAFVEVASAEDVQNAVESVNGKELNGRAVKINQARERREKEAIPSKSYKKGKRGRFRDEDDEDY
ncbi:MAG TPA: RNA-binding protein [Candidatus Omnitrophota bacterium]|nr:RNA-binding protein [Candidatus Omnitrophota bacterium]HPB69159.1 RNA-binding protein [Candidatus Omnitrophota bacterium]HQO57828.1 RNA-binding protein [Candidatus Omnitrophota bacterium]